jgi:hypothetical protein
MSKEVAKEQECRVTKLGGRAERRRRAISFAFKRLMAVFTVHVLTAVPGIIVRRHGSRILCPMISLLSISFRCFRAVKKQRNQRCIRATYVWSGIEKEVEKPVHGYSIQREFGVLELSPWRYEHAPSCLPDSY